MQPSQILHAIRRNLVACLVILLVCTLAGLGVALSTKPVAAATTTLGIQPKSKETPSFSTQAKDLMPTLVELSTSPKVLDPAAASLNMKTADLSDALTVTNPPETLVLSITAKADSKQKAVDMAKATAASLNRELSSGELLGKQALGMTTSTTSPATPDNTTMERPGARASAASGLLLGLLASISYAMFRHRRDSGHSGERSGETGTGRAAAALRTLRQRTSDLLRPKPPAQPQTQPQVPGSPNTAFPQSPEYAQASGAIASQPAVPAAGPTSLSQAPAPSSPIQATSPAWSAASGLEVGSAPAPQGTSSALAPAATSQPTASSAEGTPLSAQQAPQQTTTLPAAASPAYSPPLTRPVVQDPPLAPLPTPASVSLVSSVPSTSSTESAAPMSSAASATSIPSAAPLSSASAAPAPAHSSFTAGISSAMHRQQNGGHAASASTGTASAESSPETAPSYTHAPLPPPPPTPEDLTVPASPSLAVQSYTPAPTSGSHRSPGAPDAPTRRSTALPTGQTVPASSASPASSTSPVGTSYQYPSSTTASASLSSSPAPAPGRRRASAPTSTSAPSVPTRRRITSPSADRPAASSTGWQDASSLPTTSRRRAQSSASSSEPAPTTEATRSAARVQDSAPEAESSPVARPTSVRQQAPSRRQTLARRRRMSKPRLTLVAPLAEDSSTDQTRHLTPVAASAGGRHRSPDPPDAPPPPPPPSIQPNQQMASASSAASARRSAQPPRRSW